MAVAENYRCYWILKMTVVGNIGGIRFKNDSSKTYKFYSI